MDTSFSSRVILLMSLAILLSYGFVGLHMP